MVNSKKAFMKTLEMLFVIVLSSIFLLSMIPKNINNPIPERVTYLGKLEYDSSFRDFINSNTGCFNSTHVGVRALLEPYMKNRYDYELCSDANAGTLPQTTVNLDMIFFAGNISETDYKIVRLYYWNI